MIGRVVPNLRDVSTEKIVKDAFSNLADRLKDKSVKTVIAGNLPVIHCDGGRLYQVFENLISNAIKFLRDMDAPRIEIGYQSQGRNHQFYVKDNGIGIDAKFHSAIFEKFYRLPEVEDEEGTGLGLPIVERIVEGQGGTVWVVSEKNKGATFNFSIPKMLTEQHETIPRDRCCEKTSEVA